MQIKKGEGRGRKGGDKRRKKKSLFPLHNLLLLSPFFFIRLSLPCFVFPRLISTSPSPPLPPFSPSNPSLSHLTSSSSLPSSLSLLTPLSLIISFLSLVFLSPLWSICDPDIHHRRLTSCVWASSVPRLLLFIPRCVCEQYGLHTV